MPPLEATPKRWKSHNSIYCVMTESKELVCKLKEHGFKPGSCRVKTDGKHALACQATLKRENKTSYRLITSIHLSRPENYLSIYQSGCNFSSRIFLSINQGAIFLPGNVIPGISAKSRTEFGIPPGISLNSLWPMKRQLISGSQEKRPPPGMPMIVAGAAVVAFYMGKDLTHAPMFSLRNPYF